LPLHGSFPSIIGLAERFAYGTRAVNFHSHEHDCPSPSLDMRTKHPFPLPKCHTFFQPAETVLIEFADLKSQVHANSIPASGRE
jgi:hypothetical protein